MSFAPVALLAAGTAVGAIGAEKAGEASSHAASYNAQVARNNETVANQNADYAIKSGIQKAETESLRSAALVGRVKAAQGANGVDVNSGSALDTRVGAREAGKLNTDTTMSNAQLQAYGYRSQAQNFAAQSNLDEAQSREARDAGNIKALGTLLNGASALGGGGSGGDSGLVGFDGAAPNLSSNISWNQFVTDAPAD